MSQKKFGIGSVIFFTSIFIVLTFLFTAVGLNNYYSVKSNKVYADKAFLQKLSNIDDIINNYFYFDYDESQLEDMTIKGYVEGLGDQFTHYLNPEEAKAYTQSSNGEMYGIGIYATYDEDTDSIYITNVMKDSPAEKAGLLAGDIIKKVGDLVVSKATYYKAIYSVPGVEGTDVTITISRYPDYKSEETMTLKRAKITIDSVNYELLDNDIAYIQITEFNENTDEQFLKVLTQLKTDGAKSIIFDVRNNPGGLLDSVVNILDPLLPEGPVVHTVDKDGKIFDSKYSDANELDLPMVVLTNRNTASGGELFCSALRDYKKATLIGEKTFGKGCMQQVYPMSDGSLLIYTTNLYNPPYGENYHGVGVEPAVKVEMTDEMMQKFSRLTREEDTQFQAALAEIATLTSK